MPLTTTQQIRLARLLAKNKIALPKTIVEQGNRKVVSVWSLTDEFEIRITRDLNGKDVLAVDFVKI